MITASSHSRLSRRVLWGIILLFALPGLFARAPWTPDDAVGFGQAYALMGQPLSQWAIGFVGDRLYAEDGLLSAWLAALLGLGARGLGLPHEWLDDVMRLGNLFWLILAGWAIWNTTYRLARRVELQPENPFGNAPSRVDYARAVADASVLCLISTLGLMVRAHFQVPELAELAGIALMLLAAVRALDRPIGAGWMLGWSFVVIYFARGWAHWLPFMLALLISAGTHNSLRFGLLRRLLRAALVFGLPFSLWFMWVMEQPKGNLWWDEFNTWNMTRYLILDPLDSLGLDKLAFTAQTLSWFYWPTLPMAAWTLWQYRHATKEPAIRIPLAGCIAGFVVIFFTNPADQANYLPLLVPLSVLAAIGLSTMRRSLISLIDWFALLWFTFMGALVWLGWSAATFGVPAQIARNFEKLSPGYVPSLSLIEISVAILASLAWLRLVVWRTGKSSKAGAVWRPMVLSSGGITLIWLLLMTLWIPRIDYAKSYAPVGSALRDQLHLPPPTLVGSNTHSADNPNHCIGDLRMNLGQRAVLEYHSQIPFVYTRSAAHFKACNHLLIEDSVRNGLPLKNQLLKKYGDDWEVLWIGGRNSDRKEQLILFRRKAALQPAQ